MSRYRARSHDVFEERSAGRAHAAGADPPSARPVPPADVRSVHAGRSDIGSVLRTTRELLRDERWSHWVLVFALALMATAAEALAAALIYVLLGMVAGDGELALPLVGSLERYVAGVETQTMFVAVSVVIAVFFVLRAILLVVQAYVQHRVTLHAGVRVARRLFAGYLSMPYPFHLRRNSSELIRNCHESISILTRDVLHPGIKAVSEGLVTLGVIGVLLWTAPLASVVAVGVLGLTAGILLRIVHPRIEHWGAVHQEQVTRTFKVLQQGLGGIREILVLGRQPTFSRTFEQTKRGLARANYSKTTLSEVPRAAMEAALVIFIVCFFLVAVTTRGTALDAVPVLGVFAYAAMRLKPSTTVIIRSLNSVRFAGPAVEQLRAELALIDAAASTGAATDANPLPFEHRLSLEDVAFTYEQARVPALSDVTFGIERGSAIGVVGPTGAGKTTLLDLLLGLLPPTRGRITVDGVDIHEDIAGWRRNLGVVPQSIFLTDDTLRRNIAFGVEDDEIDDAQVLRAVRLAQLEPFLEGLPDGLDTELGERGVRVSGGQRQRIAIARALYWDPAVLVFDEGTSALDNRTEAEFMQALRNLRGTRTIIMVAHRLSTVRDCDQIVVIDQGRVLDVGTYDGLLAESASFRQLAQPTAQPT